MGVLEIFYRCAGDTRWLYWKYLIGVLELLMGVLEFFMLVLFLLDGCPGVS